MTEEPGTHGSAQSAEQPAADYRQAYEQAQAQLLAYARDLALAYAAQKRMAQYLPGDLRDRITAGSHSTSGERRQVTVLFADLVDFSKLSSRLEVEEVFSLINASFRRLVSHIFKHGGMIDKFLGDGIMAVFGASETREDDAFRAVRAALDMAAEIREFSQEMLPRLGVPLQLHIGINAGQVIAGSVGVDEQLAYTVLGTPVNVAFRLQELAEAGTILVGESVFQKTKHLFDYRYMGEFELKGIREPVHVYHAQQRPQTETPPRVTASLELPFVGRDSEMLFLNQLSQRLVLGEGGTLLVTGVPGAGKTCLVRKWLLGLQDTRVTVWTGQSDEIRQHISYSMWRHMKEKVFPASPGDKTLFEASGSSVWATWGGTLPPAALALAQVYNQPSQVSSQEARMQAFSAVRESVITWANRAPIIIVVDAWQWVDDISRQLLISLAPLTDQYPILFCLLASETESQDDSHKLLCIQSGKGYQRLHMEPLSPPAVAALLQGVVGTRPLDSAIQTAILEQNDGTPLSLTLLIQALLSRNDKAYHNHDLAAVPPPDLSTLGLSGGIDTIIKTTIDGLPNYLREVADYAAVIGPTFAGELLHAIISQERPAKGLTDSIIQLSNHGIIEPTVTDSDTYVFRHAAIQEALYANLPPNRNKVLHRAVADQLVTLTERGKTVEVELIAYHFLRAGLPAASVPYLIQAAKLAQRQAAHQLSTTYHLAAMSALDNAPIYQSERMGLQISLANTYMHARQFERAMVYYRAALDLCRQDKKRVELHQLLGRAYAEQGDLTRAWTQMEEALELLARASLPAHSLTRGRVYADCAQLQWRLGNESQADLWAREALAILEGTQEHAGLNASYQTLSHVYAKLGQHSLAAHYAAKATGSYRHGTPEGQE